jgi:arylsulfatase A-like enzyme
MRRTVLIFLAIAICGLVAAVVLLTTQEPKPVLAESADAAVPAHYFIAANPDVGDVLECRLSAYKQSLWEIWSRPPERCTLGAGWTGAGSSGSTAFGDESRVTFFLDDPEWRSLTVRAKTYPSVPESEEQALDLEVNGRQVGRKIVGRHWTDLVFDLDPTALRQGRNDVVLRFDKRVSPAEAGLGSDRRSVAATVDRIVVSRLAPTTDGDASAAPTQIFDRSSGLFTIEVGGTLVIPTTVPEGATELVIEARYPRRVSARAAALDIGVRSIAGDVVDEGSLELKGPRIGPASRRGRREIPVREHAGEHWLVTVTVDALGGGLPVEVFPPTFVVQERPERPHPRASGEPRRPDLVLITLDAAREDHFSCYGYGRPTTPKIDRFAGRALVFKDAFALAPYTLCSVPTMITGLSFLDHGVLRHQDTLSPDVTTLAEQLQAAGYRTACFSATPNNSIAKGFDQGYQEFFELWKEAPRSTSRRASYVTGRVVEWLESVDPSTPLHLQVHYVPPHAPYTPPSVFDLFTDPTYAGPCDGKFGTLVGLEAGTVDPGDGCLDHVIGLYDGNLRFADAAVGRLLAVLRARPRWRDTVVLITADHGEAFLEHGFTGHNSTVYDEMLHVPFILRVPGWMDTSQVDTDGIVTLADIVPTLLGAAGITPGDRLAGVNLLSRGGGAGDRRQRYFVATNTNIPPELGIRTSHWKAILLPSGQGRLYDLEEDPVETSNLVFDDPVTFAGLGLILTERATRYASVAPSGETAHITDEDREMLRALGYLDADDGDRRSPTPNH